MSRVEVLRGPQNVLFGRSSEGGTVNIVTAVLRVADRLLFVWRYRLFPSVLNAVVW